MNITRIFPYFAGLALLATSCANENVLQEVQPGNGTISFTLGGSAKPKTTRATVADEEKESHIENVLAVLFDKESGFYKTVESNGIVDGKYEFNVERDGSYDIYFVANADADLKEKLQSIVPGTKITDTENVLETITATQAPDVDNQFLMLSTTPASVEKIAVKDTRDLGTISMKRLAARFDIVNRAPGITITGITLKNRALKSAVSSPNTEPTDISDWYDTQRYDATTAPDSWPEDFKCENDANPVAFGKTIYSYENFSGTTGFSSENIPVIEIEYLDEDGETVRTHEIMLKDSETGEARAVQRNHLYRITLHGKYDLKFNVEVLDWNDAESFEFSDLPFLTYTQFEQEEANNKLRVAKFMYRTVSSIGSSNNVTLLTSSSTATSATNLDIWSPSAEFQYDGETYRLPSTGELHLLCPFKIPDIDNIKYNQSYNVPKFTENVNYTKAYTSGSYIGVSGNFLQTNTTFKVPTPYTLTGISELATGEVNSTPYYTGTTFSTSSSGNSKEELRPVYGLRFKGTDQFAAYKWEVIPGNKCYYTVIKIKALPKDSRITIEDIVDNVNFWSKGYLELRLYSRVGDSCNFPSKNYTADKHDDYGYDPSMKYEKWYEMLRAKPLSMSLDVSSLRISQDNYSSFKWVNLILYKK